MNRRATAPLASVVVVSLILIVLTACGSSSPSASPSPSSPAASKASSSPSAASSASPATSPAGSAAAAPAAAGGSITLPGASEQAYQKALADFKQVEEAARQEGEATIYGVPDAELLQKLQVAFNKIDPKIQVKLMRVIGAQAVERFKAEQANKQYIGNAYYGTVLTMADDGLLQDLDMPALYDPSAKWTVNPVRDRSVGIVNVTINKLLLIYNTQLVPDAEAPKTWKDLADPKWKDKLIVWDPRISSFTMDLLGYLYYHPDYGPEWVKKVALNVRTAPDSTEPPRAVARGEASVAIGAPGTFATLTGAPVKANVPSDGAFATATSYFLIKNAPQANTARVFGNWLLSKEAQSIISGYYGAVRNDIKSLFDLAQITPGEKLMPDVPYTLEYQKKVRGEPVKIYTQWMNEAGR